MIDGVKILCIGTDWRLWHSHTALNFVLSVHERTGEVLNVPRVAALDGLHFRLCPKADGSGDFTPMITGSLHQFWNKGGGNANDFPADAVAATVARLRDEFGVVPETAVLQNLEFGVNIPLTGATAQTFVSNVVSMPNKSFLKMNAKKPTLGRVCKRNEYGVKIYDKERQQDETKGGAVLRVEVAAKKARFLKSLNASVLSDLSQPLNLSKLGGYLLRVFDDVIYYDGSIDEKRFLTKKEVIKLREFCSGYFWEKLDREKRRYYLAKYKNL